MNSNDKQFALFYHTRYNKHKQGKTVVRLKETTRNYISGLAIIPLLSAVLVAAPVSAAISITEYTAPNASGPHGITEGPDGNVWFTEFNTNQIGKMAPDGTMIAEYPLAANSHPNSIVSGPDGNLWFTEYATPAGLPLLERSPLTA